jgi:uncharacterized protein
LNTSQTLLLDGPAGKIDLRIDTPAQAPLGVAWLGHPHPLFGGTRDNKVVQTVNRALLTLGYRTVMPNFRGVGQSEGSFDNGVGELQDALFTAQWIAQQWPGPLVLAGFSFGSAIAAMLSQTLLSHSAQSVEQTVLIGTAVTRWSVPPVAPNSLVIHGSEDDVIPLSDVLAWAQPIGVTVSVIDEAGHFFHGRLNQLKNRLFDHWNRPDLRVPESI